MKKNRIYVLLRGGLGNQLFIFSSAYAYSKKSNRKLILLDGLYELAKKKREANTVIRNFELAKFPDINDNFVKGRSIFKSINYFFYRYTMRSNLISKVFGIYNMDFEHDLQKVKIITGYLQTPNKFESFRPDLLKLFSLQPEIELQIENRINSYRNSGEKIVAIHVRRGDYLLRNVNGPVLSAQYYKRCIKYFSGENVKFLVFSDDITWCKMNLIAENISYVIESDPVISLRMMSYCNDFILSLSTFSWWGAWLANRTDKRSLVPFPFPQDDFNPWDNLLEESFIRIKSDFEENI
jgi:hypothetical protein